MTVDRKKFIKSASTKTPVANSKRELEQMLTRYGCRSFAVQHNYTERLATVTFVVPDTLDAGAVDVPVQLDVRTANVAKALFGPSPNGYTTYGYEQAERVAWRQVLLWVDAALSAAAAGVQPISEAFFAQTLIRDPESGHLTRIVDQMDRVAPGGTWKALLPGSTS